MGMRKNAFENIGAADVMSAKAVNREVARVFTEMYGRNAMPQPDLKFADFPTPLFGENPDAHPCDTPYHDLQSGDLSLLCRRSPSTPAISPESLGLY